MAEHAEFAASRQRLRAEADADAEQADQHCDDFQHVSYREGMVENGERRGTYFTGCGDLNGFRTAEPLTQGLRDPVKGGAGCQPERGIVCPPVARELDVGSA